MKKIKIIHDRVGSTLSCDETSDEMIIMKDKTGKAIGFEILNYVEDGVSVETTVKTIEAA